MSIGKQVISDASRLSGSHIVGEREHRSYSISFIAPHIIHKEKDAYVHFSSIEFVVALQSAAGQLVNSDSRSERAKDHFSGGHAEKAVVRCEFQGSAKQMLSKPFTIEALREIKKTIHG